MGISEEAARLRESVPEQFRPALEGDTPDRRAEPISNGREPEIVFVDGSPEQILSGAPLTEGERRNAEARLAREGQDEALIAEKAGTRAGRILVSGDSARQKEAAEARTRNRANADARMQTMLALQAQLDRLRDQYKAADNDIWDMLGKHLSPEELNRLRGIEDRDEQAREQMRVMREKLEDGKISPAEFAAFEARWKERHAIGQEIAEVERIMEHGTDAERIQAAKQRDIDVVREARDKASPEMREKVEETLIERDTDGNTAQETTAADELAFASGGLFGGSKPAGAPISAANALAPDNTVRAAAPDLRADYAAATASMDPVRPQATAELDIPKGNPAAETGLG